MQDELNRRIAKSKKTMDDCGDKDKAGSDSARWPEQHSALAEKCNLVLGTWNIRVVVRMYRSH